MVMVTYPTGSFSDYTEESSIPSSRFSATVCEKHDDDISPVPSKPVLSSRVYDMAVRMSDGKVSPIYDIIMTYECFYSGIRCIPMANIETRFTSPIEIHEVVV
jgi:hypothetical protein